ncbi:MAG: pentapeptide repeat-containing protein, partial [Mycobacterium sp.]
LLRRTLSPVGADVGLWGTAACVTTGNCSGKDLGGADLYGQDLSGVKFTGATLTKADLGTARLAVVELSNANLTGANLASANLVGATAQSANFTGANLTRATLVNADLGDANLTNADLSLADLTGVNINGIVPTGLIWHDTTCPNGSKSSEACSPILFSDENKPGLLSSDWLRVNSETGEYNGDEPVLLTTYLTTTLGYPGSSKTNVVDTTPNEIGSGVDAGDKIRIPDYTGDTWINYDAEGKGSFVPISTIDIATAALLKKAVPLPVIVTVTMALEGDLSLPETVGEWGTLLFKPKLNTLGKELEATKIYVGTNVKQVNVTAGGSGYTTVPTVKFSGGRPDDLVGNDAEGIATLTGGVVTGVTISEPGSGYLSAPTVTFTGGDGTGAQGTAVLEDARPIKDQLKAVLDEAQDRIAKSLAIKWYEIAGLAAQRIRDWVRSAGDPDDPVGLGATILIPVTSDVVDLITELGGPAALGLDSNYTRLHDFDPEKAGQQDYKLIIPVPGWGATIQVREGLLVPPGAGNKPQEWTTEYSGAYFGNQVANWTVDTQAWVRTIW